MREGSQTLHDGRRPFQVSSARCRRGRGDVSETGIYLEIRPLPHTTGTPTESYEKGPRDPDRGRSPPLTVTRPDSVTTPVATVPRPCGRPETFRGRGSHPPTRYPNSSDSPRWVRPEPLRPDAVSRPDGSGGGMVRTRSHSGSVRDFLSSDSTT